MELHQITPMVPCTRLQESLDFYCDLLGFEVTFQAENYAFLRRDQVAIRLIEVDADLDLHHPMKQQEFYIDVLDLDSVYEQLAPRLADLPKGRVRPPFNQDYGQREFHVTDPDCTLIFFGEPFKSDAIKPLL